MPGPLLLYLLAVTVKHDQTVLRAGCGDDEPVVAHLAAGTPVEIRFALADGSACYKVEARTGGGEVLGYVVGRDLAGLDEFERQRRGGEIVPDALRPAPPRPVNIAMRTADPLLGRVSQLLDANQPREALDLLEPALR